MTLLLFSDYARNRKNTVYELFEGIRRTMVNIELKGPAVFIGRCSTVILGESPRVLKSFIYSSDTEKRGGTHYPNGKCFGD